MLPVLLSLRNKLIPGMAPSVVESAEYLWESAENVLFVDEGAQPGWRKTVELSGIEFPVRGLHGQRMPDHPQMLFFGTLTKLFVSSGLNTPIDVSATTYSLVENASPGVLADMWQFVSWGNWTVITNGQDPVGLYRPVWESANVTWEACTSNWDDFIAGSVALGNGANPMPFTWAKLIGKIGPFVFVANTNNYVNEVRWCSQDNVEDWTPTAINSAGDHVIRDLESEIIAAVPLGERYLLYGADTVHSMAYIGAPFYFGFQRVMTGVGAVGYRSVCSAGRQNYGLGMQGFFVTDGTQASYIDEPMIRQFFWADANRAQISKTTCFHNEDKNRIEWWYQRNNGTMRGIAYDYRLRAWALIDEPGTVGIERDVFEYPLVATMNGEILSINNGTLDEPTLVTKALDFGSPQTGKFLGYVYFYYRGPMNVQLGWHNRLNDPVTWGPVHSLTGDNLPVYVNVTARYFRVKITGATDWRIGGIDFHGHAGGTKK